MAPERPCLKNQSTHLTPAGFNEAVTLAVSIILASVVVFLTVGMSKKPLNVAGTSATSLVYWSRFATVAIFDIRL